MSDNDRREKEFVRGWMLKSRRTGDYYWRMAHAWSGLGDYTEADEGEAPRNVQ